MGHIKFLSAIAALAVLGACGGSISGSPVPADFPTALPTDTVSGTVTFKGNPLPGATVTAWATNTNTVYQTATTDSSGNYKFSGIETSGDVPEELQSWVNKAGYGFYPSVGIGAKVSRVNHTGQFAGNGVEYYWTSTTNASDTTEAWTVFSCDFGVYNTPKSNTGYTLAVR